MFTWWGACMDYWLQSNHNEVLLKNHQWGSDATPHNSQTILLGWPDLWDQICFFLCFVPSKKLPDIRLSVFVMACWRRGMILFIGNLKQSTRSFGPVWFERREQDRLLSWPGCSRGAAGGCRQTSGAPSRTEEIEQTGHKWDGALSFSVGSHFRTILFDWVSTFLCSLSLLLHTLSTFISSAIITTTQCLALIKCPDRSFRCLSHTIKLTQIWLLPFILQCWH